MYCKIRCAMYEYFYKKHIRNLLIVSALHCQCENRKEVRIKFLIWNGLGNKTLKSRINILNPFFSTLVKLLA
jgi:hypothetical protein